MKKQIIKEQIFIKHYDGLIRGFLFSDLPKDILPTDIIDIEKEEGMISENNSYDDSSRVIVYRERLENDREFEIRKDKWDKKMNELRDGRLKLYEKLKQEFE